MAWWRWLRTTGWTPALKGAEFCDLTIFTPSRYVLNETGRPGFPRSGQVGGPGGSCTLGEWILSPRPATTAWPLDKGDRFLRGGRLLIRRAAVRAHESLTTAEILRHFS
jgi:hypothetical protein